MYGMIAGITIATPLRADQAGNPSDRDQGAFQISLGDEVGLPMLGPPDNIIALGGLASISLTGIMALTYPAGDEPGVLRPEVNDQNGVLITCHSLEI
jgi:hypothetical protein